MATSSITKQFVIKDPKVYEKLMTLAERKTDRTATKDSPSLNKGREALKSFSCR